MQREQPNQGPRAETSTSGEILSDRRIEEALCALHRSVAAAQFYPPQHPALEEAVRDGYQVWARAESDHRWEHAGLRVRNATLWLGESCVGKDNPAVLSLARTLSSHAVVSVARRGSLAVEGYALLTSLLASPAEGLRERGGLAAAWRRTPHAECLELQALAAVPAEKGARRGEGVGGEVWGRGLSGQAELESLSDPALLARLKAFQQRGPKERNLLDLLLRLGAAENISTFLQLLKEITRAAQDYAEMERYREAFHVSLFLFREAQNMDALGKSGMRDYLLDALRLLVRGPFLQWTIAHATSEESHREGEEAEFLLRAVGKPAIVPIINALVGEKSRLARRRLVDVLVAIGESVVPFAVKMLEDQRWYVVRNMVTVLGAVGSIEAVRALARLVGDPDPRVRREVARALGRIPGDRSEEVLLSLVQDADASVRLMAIGAAAGFRSQRVHDALWDAFRRIGIRSADWTLKPPVLQSIGRLGLSDAVEGLVKVVRTRRFLGRRRWLTIQVAAVNALGEVGGERAVEVLTGLREHKEPELRKAAVRALGRAGAAAESG